MSKITDVLNNVSAKKRASHTEIQDEIARTYFHTPHKKGGKKKAGWKPILPWFAAAAALLVAVLIVLSRSSIDIKVRVLGEIPSFSAGKAAGSPDEGLFLVNGGEPNRDIVKNARFTGDAVLFSAAKPDELICANSRSAGWANYTIELKEPADLNKLDIKYTAKGIKGDEYLAIVVIDSNKRVYRLEKDLSSALGKDWQRYTINFRRLRKAIDFSNVSAIRFEFGSLTAGNYPNSIIFLKDISLTKTRRLKWL